ncbi:MAG: TIGR04282 family arsenosugar biosynthesis glycosyltransferase [Gammaproteobacteria bacterium]|nr:TIGR04282 family arsenosugar biosynthesis glycosyltransferase [Gammaproteobacteria bacterium]
MQFAKAPVPGAVKTRMLPELNARQACALHRQLVRHTLAQLLDSRIAPVQLHCDQANHAGVQAWQQDFDLERVYTQVSGNLGEKMQQAFAQLLARQDVDQVLLVGSDCPFIDCAYLEQAVQALQRGSDVVLGPAADGGYVLIGMCEPHAGVFAGIDWGTSSVLEQTLTQVQQQGLTVALLPELHDIDRPQDLARLGQLQPYSGANDWLL